MGRLGHVWITVGEGALIDGTDGRTGEGKIDGHPSRAAAHGYSGMPQFVVQNVTATNGFAYGVVGADLHVHGDGTPLYLLERFQQAPGWDVQWLRELPSRMLDARSEVVPFTGRERDLADLREWRDGGPRLAVRLLNAPGGQGKTRLAARFAAESVADGWLVVVAGHGVGDVRPSPGSQDLRLDGHRGVLLLLDYADRWNLTASVWLLRNSLLHRPDRPARVLMLARTPAGLPGLRAELDKVHIRAGLSDQPLAAVPETSEGGQRWEMFAAARDSFARLYGVADPGAVAAPADLDYPEFGLVLTLHLAALVAVDAHVTGHRPPTEPDQLSRYLLDREQRHWEYLYEQRGRGLDYATPPSVMARTAFTAALTGPLSYADAIRLLERVEHEEPAERIITDHGRCYPVTGRPSATVLTPLYPDRLAEDYLAHTLPGHRDSSQPVQAWAAERLRQVVRDPTSPTEGAYVARAITVLAAAAGRWPHVGPDHLFPLLVDDPRLALLAGNAALMRLASSPTIDMAVLRAIESVLPPSAYVDLDLGAAAVTKRLTEELLQQPVEDRKRAELHGVLAVRLSNAGRLEEAIDAFQASVAVYRALAGSDPDEYDAPLAAALDALAVALAGQGRRADSLGVSGEAVQLFRSLAAAGADSYRFALAHSLNNLSNWLADQDLGEEALDAATEAAELLRPLTQTDAARYEPVLAIVLDTLTNRLREAERHRDALVVAQEANELHKRAMRANPGGYLPQYARALGNLGCLLLAQETPGQEARPVIEEAIRLLRWLDEDNPDVHRPDLAKALINLAGALRGERASVDVADEAVRLYRGLAAANPDAYLNGFMMALMQLGGVATEAGDREAAIDAYLEALSWHRKAPEAASPLHRPLFAVLPLRAAHQLYLAGRESEAVSIIRNAVAPDPRTLNRIKGTGDRAQLLLQQCMSLQREGAPGKAAKALAEAIRLLRQETTEDIESTAEYIDILEFQALLLGEANDHPAVEQVCREFVPLRRLLYEADPKAHGASLQRDLETLVVALINQERHGEALQLTRESCELGRRLAAGDPIRQSALAMALNRFVLVRLHTGEECDEALGAAREAAAIDRRLADADPEGHLPVLVASLTSFGDLLDEIGRQQEALEVAEETLAVRRRLAASDEAHRPGLATALSEFSLRLSRLGRREEALAAVEEAVDIRRALLGAEGEARLPELSVSLHNRCLLLRELNRDQDFLIAIEEVIAVYRRLVERDGDAYLPDVAGGLNDQAIVLRGQGRDRAAVSPLADAVAISRRIRGTDREANLADIAAWLNNLGCMYADLGHPERALAILEEAVTACRHLSEADPDAGLPWLATTLNDLGTVLGDLGGGGQASLPLAESVAIHRRLVTADSKAHLPGLAMALHNLASQLAAGRAEEGLAAAEEAVAIRMSLAKTDPEAYLPKLANSLCAYAWVCAHAGVGVGPALSSAQAAVTLYQSLAQQAPHRFDTQLREASQLLADLAHAAGALGPELDIRAAVPREPEP